MHFVLGRKSRSSYSLDSTGPGKHTKWNSVDQAGLLYMDIQITLLILSVTIVLGGTGYEGRHVSLLYMFLLSFLALTMHKPQ